jgi:hypothetical protein
MSHAKNRKSEKVHLLSVRKRGNGETAHPGSQRAQPSRRMIGESPVMARFGHTAGGLAVKYDPVSQYKRMTSKRSI